jgi:hypothetical protein
MKKLIITDLEQIYGLDLIGSGIWNFGWEAQMFGQYVEKTINRDVAHIAKDSTNLMNC